MEQMQVRCILVVFQIGIQRIEYSVLLAGEGPLGTTPKHT